MNDTILYGDLVGSAAKLEGYTFAEHLWFATRDVILFVDCNSDKSKEDGTQEYPFKTIQAAVNSVNLLCNHFTINIADGTYNEDVKILDYMANGVYLEGASKAGVKIKSIIARSLKHLWLHNLTVFGVYSEEYGRGFETAWCNTTIDDCDFVGCEESQVGYISHGGSTFLNGCSFTNTKIGISAIYGASVEVTECTFSGNTQADLHAGGGFIGTDVEGLKTLSTFGGIVASPKIAQAIADGTFNIA